MGTFDGFRMTRFFDNAFLHKFNQNQTFNGELLRTDFCEIAGKRARARTSCVQFACDRLAFQNVGSQLNYAHAFFFHFFDKVKNKNFIDDYFQTSDKFSDSLAG